MVRFPGFAGAILKEASKNNISNQITSSGTEKSAWIVLPFESFAIFAAFVVTVDP